MLLGHGMHIRCTYGHYRRTAVKRSLAVPVHPFAQGLCQQLYIPGAKALQGIAVAHQHFNIRSQFFSSQIFQRGVQQRRVFRPFCGQAKFRHLPGALQQGTDIIS